MTSEKFKEDLMKIHQAIRTDPMNASFTERNIQPLYKVHPDAKILVVGQAPGRKAEETGLFWNDPSGDRLRDWLDMSYEEFYSTDLLAHLPMDFYFPGKAKTGDQQPRKDFANKWHPQLLDLLPNLELTLLLGRHAQTYYLQGRQRKTLTETVEHYEDYLPDYFPLPHPSPLNNRWLIKNPWFNEEVLPDLKRLTRRLLKK